MSTKTELRDEVLAEMNARRIDHKTYINSEWLLSEYESTLRKEQEEAVAEAVKAARERAIETINKVTGHALPDDHDYDDECMTCMILEALTPQNTKTDTH